MYTVPALSAGDAKSDAIGNLLAAIAYDRDTMSASMRFTLLHRRGVILPGVKQLALVTS